MLKKNRNLTRIRLLLLLICQMRFTKLHQARVLLLLLVIPSAIRGWLSPFIYFLFDFRVTFPTLMPGYMPLHYIKIWPVCWMIKCHGSTIFQRLIPGLYTRPTYKTSLANQINYNDKSIII